MKFVYKTTGVCPSEIELEVNDNKITSVEFNGGCNGNLKALKKVITGMNTDDVIKTFSGITCGKRETSCTDQLAKALIELKRH